MEINLTKIAQEFIAWTKRKIWHHFNETNRQLYFYEKEVWWAALGKNIGFEIDGKHDLFERPVLILKKYSKDMCFVVPFTSQVKSPPPWYQVVAEVNGKVNAANISQGKAISSRRLLRRKSVMEAEDYERILNKFTQQFQK